MALAPGEFVFSRHFASYFLSNSSLFGMSFLLLSIKIYMEIFDRRGRLQLPESCFRIQIFCESQNVKWTLVNWEKRIGELEKSSYVLPLSPEVSSIFWLVGSRRITGWSRTGIVSTSLFFLRLCKCWFGNRACRHCFLEGNTLLARGLNLKQSVKRWLRLL